MERDKLPKAVRRARPEGRINLESEVTTMEPTRKDMAEFFRLSLLAGFGEPAEVIRWADSIVGAEASPHIAFIELCIAVAQPTGRLGDLLHEVPGQVTPELPVRMLLGAAARFISAHAADSERMLLRLYRVAGLEHFPERIYFQLVSLEDAYALARDGVYGTLAEVRQDFAAFLQEYEPYASGTIANMVCPTTVSPQLGQKPN